MEGAPKEGGDDRREGGRQEGWGEDTVPVGTIREKKEIKEENKEPQWKTRVSPIIYYLTRRTDDYYLCELPFCDGDGHSARHGASS